MTKSCRYISPFSNIKTYLNTGASKRVSGKETKKLYTWQRYNFEISKIKTV